MTKSRMTLNTIATLCFLFAAILTYVRLFWGVDFTDEAFTVALPYRFVLGDKPFLDDFSMAQSSAIFLIPLSRLFHFFNSENSSVVLYFRHLYFVFSLGVSLLIAKSLFENFSSALALLPAALFLLFIPDGIPNLTSQTLSIGFYFIGILWVLIRSGLTGPWLFGSGLLHAFAIVAFPPIAVAVGFFVFPLMYLMKGNCLKALLNYLSGVVFTLLVFYAILPANFEDYAAVFTWNLKNATEMGHAMGWAKVQEILSEFTRRMPQIFGVILLGVGNYFAVKKNPLAGFLFAVLLTSLIFIATRASQGGGGPSHYVAYSAIFFFVLAIPFAKDAFFKKFAIGIVVPCFAAGLCLAFASINGFSASSTVLILPFIFLQALLLKTYFTEWAFTKNDWVLPLVFLPIFIQAAVLARFQYKTVFQDDSISELTQTVESGPFKHLKTTPEKFQYLTEIQTALTKAAASKKTISFYPHFPAGYLLTQLRPQTRSLYESCNPYLNAECLEPKNSDLVILVGKLFYTKDRTEVFASLPIPLEGYEPLSSTPNFQISARK